MTGSNPPSIVVVQREGSLVEPTYSPLADVPGVRTETWVGTPGAEAYGRPPGDLAEALYGVEALIHSPWTMGCIADDEFWRAASSLRVIAGAFDNRFAGWLDIQDAQRRGVTVIDTSRDITSIVAEYGVAMTLNLVRNIPAGIGALRNGEWPGFALCERTVVGPARGGGLDGMRIGLAGFGSICRNYARLITPFGCTLRSHDPFVSADAMTAAGVEAAGSLVELAAASDVLVVGIPPTPQTIGVIDADVIDALPAGSFVVVLSRMALLDQAALWRRAERGEIGVATDVFEPEPPSPDAPFLRWPNVLPTPHMAGQGKEGSRRSFDVAAREALAALAGEPVRYAVTSFDDRLYRGIPTAG